MGSVNPTGKHRKKRRHHGDGTVILRRDHWRRLPWLAVVPYLDEAGQRRKMYRSAASQEAAEEARKDLVRKLAAVPARSLVMTLHEYAADWLDGQREHLAPGSLDRYRAHLERRILPTLGSVALADLSVTRIRAAAARWDGAASTREGTTVVLKAMLREAERDGLLTANPARFLRAPRERPAPHVALDVDDARRLLAAARAKAEVTTDDVGDGYRGPDSGDSRRRAESDSGRAAAGISGGSVRPVPRVPRPRADPFYALLVTTLGLGLRRGEALGLRVSDVDLPAGTVRISHSLRRIPPDLRAEGEGPRRLVAPKHGSYRTLPLPGLVADALAERLAELAAERKAARTWAPNDLVFCNPDGTPIAFSRLARWFEALQDWVNHRARIGPNPPPTLAPLRWHDLRGSAATILLAEGVDVRVVQAILGHRRIEQTAEYAKVLPRVSREAAGKMGRALG